MSRSEFPYDCYEVPGGTVEADETHEQAARREFLEETGYEVGYSKHLLTITPSVGYSNELISVYQAPVTKLVSEGEFDFGFYAKKDVRDLINSGRLIDAQSLGALSLWFNREDSGSFAPSIIFLCTGNYYRSRFCEIYLNHLLKTEIADSKGLMAYRKINEGPMSKYTVQYLNELEIDIPAIRFPDQMEERHFNSVQRIIALDRSEHHAMLNDYFPAWKDKIEYWEVHDIDKTDPGEALPVLKQKVEALAAAIGEQ